MDDIDKASTTELSDEVLASIRKLPYTLEIQGNRVKLAGVVEQIVNDLWVTHDYSNLFNTINNLDSSDFLIPNKCPVFNIPFKLGNFSDRATHPSVDRIIPSLGYTKGNIKIISYRANQLKSNGTLDEFRKILTYMKINNCL